MFEAVRAGVPQVSTSMDPGQGWAHYTVGYASGSSSGIKCLAGSTLPQAA